MRKFLAFLAAALLCLVCEAQIVNRLKVDGPTFQRYAWGRMQLFNPSNLPLADSLYKEGVQTGSYKLRCLGLSLEMPVRYAQGEYERMDACAQEIKTIFDQYKVPTDILPFYYSSIHEYCQYLIGSGRVSDAMLEARAMDRRADKERSDLGRMYAYRIIGLIQSYRSHPWAAVENFTRAAEYCTRARAEQELPNLYLLMAQEYIRTKDFTAAMEYCEKAEAYSSLFPSLRNKCLMTKGFLYNEQENMEAFWDCYDALIQNPLYTAQIEKEARCQLDVCYFLSKGLFADALQRADQLDNTKVRLERKHDIFAAQGAYSQAYQELFHLMDVKDSIYIQVQNEDLAILDAEMNNAQLREEAQRLKARNQVTILLGFLVMFVLAFFAILMNQWQLRQNLDEMRRRNAEAIRVRRAFQNAMDAKESENAYKIKILQNRTTNILLNYEDLLNS